MKRLLSVIFTALLLINTSFAGVDKLSPEYLQSKEGFSISKYIAESIASKAIKKALKKETGANFDVDFTGYTTSSIKRGIFKKIEISGKDVNIDGIVVPYVHLNSITEYNYIDYTKTPMEFKSDMTYSYDLLLTDETINSALERKDYSKVIAKVNRIASPVFIVKKVRTKMVDDKLYILTDYNFPIAKSKDRTFVVQSDFEVVNGTIKAKNVSIDTSYGNLGLNKVANLINYLNPLEFTIDLLDDKIHKVNIENVNIVDNKIKIDGKIFVKGE